MIVTNTQSGTNIHEIAEGIYRINTPVPPSFAPGGFSFNQYLIVDEEPLLFHTGLAEFPLVQEAMAMSSVERPLHSFICGSDEWALNEWIAVRAAVRSWADCRKTR